MAEFQAVNSQLSFIRFLLGEPESAEDGRFSPAQLLLGVNEGRRWTCERTKSFQVRDSQETNPDGVITKFYQVPFDFIDFYNVEWNGIPLDIVPPQNWRQTVGENDDIQGDPFAAMYFARQLQLFFVPQTAKTLRYHGWAYTDPLTIGGQDTQFTDQQARVAMYRASWKLKALDERDFKEDKDEAEGLAAEIAKQYRPKGPRYVKTPYVRSPIPGLYGLRG